MSSAGLKKPEPINTSLPSVRLLQGYIRHKQRVEIKLMTGEVFLGLLLWIDSECLNLKTEDGTGLLIWFAALSYVKPIGSPQA